MFLVFGVIFEVLATMVGTSGKQMVSYSGRVEEKTKARTLKVGGLLLTTLIGPVLDMAAYGFAPQAIIAPLNGLDIVWNTCSAPYTLGERLTRKHVLGSALVFVGAVCTSLLGPHHSTQETLEWMQDTFLRLRFVSYLIFFGSFLLISAVTLRTRPKGVGDKARGIALASTAGAIAGNMYFISAGLGLLRSSADSGNWSAWENWLPYPVLLGGILVALANIPFITKALEEYEAIFVVTLFEGSHIVTACLSGGWVLRELEGMSFVQQFFYWCCVLVIVSGLLVIQSTAAGAGAPSRQDVRPLSETSMKMSDISTAASDPAMRDAGMEAARLAAEEAGDEENGAGGSIRTVQAQPELVTTESGSVVVWAGSISGIASAKLGAPEDEEDDSETEDRTSSSDEEGTSGSDREQAAGRSP